MKCKKKRQPFTPEFDRWPPGSPERFIHAYWQLDIMRLHAFTNECDENTREKYDAINHRAGVKTDYIDLLTLGNEYRAESRIMDIIQDYEQLVWVWFFNCEALFETSLASWLRSILTTHSVEHIRVVFLLDNQEQHRRIFQCYSTPLYQSTTALKA